MEKIYSKCCGLDVHKNLIVACLILPDQKPIIREFQSTYSSLQELAEWLLMEDCEMVAMESTADYWKTIANTFENHGISFVVVNAQHLKALSRHKTDKLDALYIAERLQFGLLKGSFVPSREQRILRQLTRGRDNFIKDRATYVNRLQKALDESGIKLSSFVSNITGTSSRKLLDYILEKRSFPSAEIINQLISTRLKASREDLADALRGKITAQQVVLIRGILRTIDNCDLEIAALSAQIDEFLSEKQSEKKTNFVK